ncbi:S-adenosyl-L-methionine-dependent methyltransferase [Xylogone sp. PMI_703]|nr:S-adenosyl-L-methionine-dependent methyltransferase [Xylogone sp. PMI_703]
MNDPEFNVEVDTTTQEILLAALHHDLKALKPYLRTPGNANVQDPETGYTPLHAAVAASGNSTEQVEEDVDTEAAKATIQELFLSGAIWNDIDMNNETPGCLAWRLGQKELYDLIVDAGVRAEILLNLMGGYEELRDEDDEDQDEVTEATQQPSGDQTNGSATTEDNTQVETKTDVNSKDYLASDLTFTSDKLLDADANGVMMAWETDIMRRSVDLLLPNRTPGARILNIGFGMGIIDREFASTSPRSHHIVEAHPAVLAKIKEEGSPLGFGSSWEASAPEGGKYVVHEGRWQEVLPKLLEDGETFDVIYFDTFGEDYSQLKTFFSEFVLGLMDSDGRFGFFNGLGADRRVCYDVYCKVVELDLFDAGLDIEWHDVEVQGLGEESEGEWKGVRRRYWTLDKYRLPICTFMG